MCDVFLCGHGCKWVICCFLPRGIPLALSPIEKTLVLELTSTSWFKGGDSVDVSLRRNFELRGGEDLHRKNLALRKELTGASWFEGGEGVTVSRQ